MERMVSVFKVFCLCMAMVLWAGACPSAAADTRIDLRTLAASRMPALLEFGKGWCKPCRHMKPILADMSRAYRGRAIVASVDMDANRNLVRQFGIRLMPTQVFLTAAGKVFFRHEGILEREHIVAVFAKMGLAPPSRGPAMIRVPGQPVAR